MRKITSKNKGADMVKRDVQDLISRYDLSREDLASRLGVSAMTVYRWEKGKMLRAIADLKTELGKRTS